MKYFSDIPLIQYYVKQRDMCRARVELMKILAELSDEALEYVWRPIVYAYYWTDGHDQVILSEDDRERMLLICVVAHESPEFVNKLSRYRLFLYNQKFTERRAKI